MIYKLKCNAAESCENTTIDYNCPNEALYEGLCVGCDVEMVVCAIHLDLLYHDNISIISELQSEI